MTSPIDPIRRAFNARRTHKRDGRAEDVSAADANLPVPVGRARTPPPEPPKDAEAVFAAQILGQEGARRGLRGGPAVIDSAKAAYNQTEWSGKHDRRARRGRVTKTDV